MAYAVANDVAVRWARVMSPEEEALVLARLEDVERMIKRRLPDLAARIADGRLLEEDVVMVEADAVLRLVRNPEGYLSETDGNYTYMLQTGTVSGRLSVLPEEWELLGVRQTRFAVLVPNLVLPT
ncbi:Gp19/Gp15/Gp42 family protein [Nocardia sp. NPDC055002]